MHDQGANASFHPKGVKVELRERGTTCHRKLNISDKAGSTDAVCFACLKYFQTRRVHSECVSIVSVFLDA